jgi:AcrR family transcriptional regulator
LESNGLEGLSLRRVAAALDTGAASLYVYLANLEELYALMLDQVLAEMPPTAGRKRGWRDRLKNYLASYLRILNKRPGLAHIAMSTISAGPNALRMWEVLLGLLEEGGIGAEERVTGVDMLLLHVTAMAAEEDNRRTVGHDFKRVQNALAVVPPKDFPRLSALFEQGLFSGSGDDDAIGWAVDVIVGGILANTHRG